MYLIEENGLDIEKDGDEKCVLLKVGNTVNPDHVKTLTVPADWSDPVVNKKWIEPNFDKADNPGGWSSYSFKPILEQTTTKKDSNNEENGQDNLIHPFQDWIFYYKGWELENAPNENGIDPIPPDEDVLFPPSYRGI
eukprot:12743811-Ditylum_brightwellii.AAC.1